MDKKLTYTVDEAAQRIGLGRNTVYALVKAKKIPAIQVGRRYVINAEMFDAWVKELSAKKAVIEL